jgi:hypothetical protein
MSATSYRLPDHHGKISVDGDVIHLMFPELNDIQFDGYPLLQIVAHTISFRADEDGMRAAEATLFLRKEMLTSGEEGLLLAFAENGTDRTAILRLYKEILSG